MKLRLRMPLMSLLVLGMALSATAQVDPNLVGWWRLDDGSGIIAKDSSGNGNDGELNGNAQWVAGMIGPALHLDGDSYVEIPHADILTVDNEVTVAAWIKADQLDDDGSGYAGIVAKSNGPRSYSLYITGNGTLHFSVNGTGGTSATAVVLDEWTHVSAQVKEGTKYYYFNGVPDPAGVTGVTLPGLADTASVLIGNTQENLEREFHGTIDDVRIYNRGLDDSEYAAVMEGNPPGLAENPSPAIGYDDALRDGLLTWKPGIYESTHNVYFGTSLEEVEGATVPTASGLTAASFDPGRLEFGQSYFWRVDEVNVTPDKTVYEGKVWNFTVEPYSIQIPGSEIMVTASSFSNEFSLPVKLVDGSGLAEDGSHDITPETMWFTGSPDMDPWIQFEFDSVKQLDRMTVWNSNGAAESAIGWGVKDVVLEYSQDGENWTVLEGVTQFSRAPGLVTYATPDEFALNGIPAKYVRIDIENNWGGILMSYGLSEVQFTMVPAQARTPEPASGAADILPGAVVTWRAGREADTHTVYLDTDAGAVADGSAPSVSTTTNSLDLGTMGLEMGKTYYWRVDEVNEAEATPVWAGPVWSLNVVNTVVVEDFESYNNFSPDRPFQAWLDGFGYSADEFFSVGYGGNGTGAGIGHDIWTLTSPHYDGDIMETNSAVNGSSQSMPFYFTNAGGAESRTDRTFAPAQDWTLGGAKTLAIGVRGAMNLATTDKLYVKVNDAKVMYEGDLTVPIWQAWHIDLADLGDVSNVTSLSIGVEGNGSGMILLDDILLHKTAPVINQPTEGDKSLVGHWTLDETEGLNVADSSGYANHGVLVGMDGTEWTTGTKGGALALSGVQGAEASPNIVRIEDSTSLQLTDNATISAWVKMDEGNDGVYMGIAGKLNTGPYRGFALVRHSSNVFRLWANSASNDLAGFDASSDVEYTDTEWHHVAGVVDGSISTLYVDGVKQAKQGDGIDLQDSETYAYIGRQYGAATSYRYWNGLVDDVKIFYRALSEQEISGL